MIQLQRETDVPPSLMEPGITIPAPHSALFENPLSIQEDTPVATPQDDLPSPESDPPQLKRETHPVGPNPINIPPQPASPPPTDSEKHEAPEPEIFRTHTTRYNIRENLQPRIYQDYIMLELSNKPALTKFLLGKNP